MGLALAANDAKGTADKEQFMRRLQTAAEVLRKSRPTAWNLFWAINRMLEKAETTKGGPSDVASGLVEEAQRIAEEDIEVNRKIGEHGSALIKDGDCVLTHCNAGTLATVSYGTALAPIRTAIARGKRIHVFATETRPRLQGAKLTTYELLRDGIPVTLIVDDEVGYVMNKRMVSIAIVGADRITSKFVANKVGTYMIALAAQANGISFYVAAPSSTFDLRPGESEVKIEERSAQEVTHIGGKRIAPKGVNVFNPAFDLTPTELVTGFVTEKGVIQPSMLSARLSA